jgi:signal transduction histidine kinase
MMEALNTCFETTNSVRSLALYSHLLPVFIGLILTYFVYKFSGKQISSVLFALLTILLSTWLVGDLITWHSNNYYLVAAFWSTLDYINILFYLALLCFFVVQTSKSNNLSGWVVATVIIIATPPLLLTIAGLSVGEFDETNCEMAGNDLLALYKLGVEWLCIATVLILGTVAAFRERKNKSSRNQILVLTLASAAFFGLFSGSEYLATQTDIYEITLYALFALPIFLLIVTYNIVEQEAFKLQNQGAILAQLLFFIFILVAIFSLILTDDVYELGVTGVSTFLTLGFGVLLLRSAKREAKQREQLEVLTKQLEAANERLKELDKQKSEFVSIASHQLRSPLTAMRGYASMLVEGSFGKIPDKALDAAKRIEDSAKLMAISVEDYLNVSRIESGNMKYNLSDFNVKEMTEKICDDLRPEAMKQNLILLFRSDLKSRGVVNADVGKTNQIIHNLINNSIKYTPKGSISVFVRDDMKLKRIYVDITDTGIGMSQETIHTLFQKFSRADNANSVNVSGTGLGLYVAAKMAEQMGGQITCKSEGDGKGSTFTFKLPLTM